MGRSIYLINPAADFPTYYGAEVYAGRGYEPAAFLADLVVPTLAAMVPADWHVELCDEHLEAVDLDTSCDFVGITGKVSQWGRMKAIATEFRRRGKTVVMGGPYASLCPEIVRPHCDVLVRDEIEDVVGDIFGELGSGRFADEYVGGRPDLRSSPVPRWDLYSKYNDRVLTATVQTARGCPFECEFCDVIQYVGRKQRHKGVGQILAELDAVYAHGYRSVLFADDNTTASRNWVKGLLEGVREWNGRQAHGPVSFSTQLSIDAARDDELLEMCSEAGMHHVFIGVETPNEESLVETHKRQNLARNLRNPDDDNPTLVDQIQRFYAHGIGVTGGMICGFDADGLDIFERQLAFAEESAMPIMTISALAAPAATPLHERLGKAGRLVEGLEVPGHPWNTNLIPEQMTREQLTEGIRWLANKVYHPTAFAERLEHFVDLLDSAAPAHVAGNGTHKPLAEGKGLRSVDVDTLALISDIPKLDPDAARMWARVMRKLAAKPRAAAPIMEALVRYQQLRYMYEEAGFWDQARYAAEARPFVASVG